MRITAQVPARRVEVLQSSGGLPAHLAGMFLQPLAFARAADGTSFVFDNRAHAVFRIDRDGPTVVEAGRDARFVVEAPAAGALERWWRPTTRLTG